MCAWGTRRGRCVNGRRLAARVVTQSSDGIEQLHAVPERRDAKLLQVLCRQARKNRLVYLILAEGRLILPEAKAPQPDHNVHDGAHNQGGAHHLLGQRGCPGQTGLWVSQRFTKTAAVISPMAEFIGDCENTGVASKS